MKKILLLAVVAVVVLAGLAHNRAKKNPVVARIEDWNITRDEFNRAIENLPDKYRGVARQHRREFLDELMTQYLFYKEAKRRHFDQDPEAREMVKKAAQKIVVAKFLDVEVFKKIQVKDSDVRQYYNEHKTDYTQPEMIVARHILVKSDTLAAEVLKQLNSGADFAALARQYSVCPSRERGGDLNMLKKGDLIPEFEEAAFNLNVGEISQPVKTALGYHIIQVTKRIDARYTLLEEVKANIHELLLAKKQQETMEQMLAALKGKAKIWISRDFMEKNEK